MTSALPRKPLLGLALAAVAGIALAGRWPPPLLLALGVVVLLGAALWLRPGAWLCRAWVAAAFGLLHSLAAEHGAAATLARQVENRTLLAEAEGVVWSEPVSFPNSRGEPLASFVLRVQRLDLAGQSISATVFCSVLWTGPAPAYGDVVRLRAEARALREPRNPGEFDLAGWQRRHGIALELSARSRADCAILRHGEGRWSGHFAIAARAWVKVRLETGFPASEETALIESMVLGMRGSTPPEMKDLFQRTGTLHLFAVSGLNVAMLAAIVWAILKPLRVSRTAACFLALPLLAAYAIATGLGASCVRATIMVVFLLAAPLVNRPAVLLNSMGGAALVILAWDTNQLFLPGFQLSFVLVIALIALSEPIARRLEPWLRPDDFLPKPLWNPWQRLRTAGWKMTCQTIGVTLAAWLGSLPFMAGYFHLLSPVAIVANAVAVPLAFFVLALGLLAILVSFTPLLPAVNAANWFFAKALLGAVSFFAAVPYGHEYIEWPRLGAAPACEITVLEAGEGAAIHLRAAGADWLLDSGPKRDYARIVLPYLRSRGVDWLDGLLLSHGDSGHVGGATELLDDFRPAWIAETALLDRSPTRLAFHAELAARRQGRRFLRRGEVLPLSPRAALRVLYPPAGLERSVADDQALVCRVEAAGRRVLFVSDAGFFTEQWLMKNEPDLHADVLVKGWHGSDFSGTADFIARVNPQVVICSPPRFGTTAAEFAEWAGAVQQKGIALFAQQFCGAVRIELRDDGELRVRGTRGSGDGKAE